jgi:hypothetical protein
LPQPAVTMPLQLDRGREHSILGVVEQLPQPIGRPTRGVDRSASPHKVPHLPGRAVSTAKGMLAAVAASIARVGRTAATVETAAYTGVVPGAWRKVTAPRAAFSFFFEIGPASGPPFVFCLENLSGGSPLTALEPGRCRCGPRGWLREDGVRGRGCNCLPPSGCGAGHCSRCARDSSKWYTHISSNRGAFCPRDGTHAIGLGRMN